MTDEKHGTRLVLLLIIFVVVTGAGVIFYTVGTPLVLIAIQQAREAARRRQVENNLKQLGIATTIYANEQSSRIYLDGLPAGKRTWASELATNAEMDVLDTFVCPSYKPYKWVRWENTYGIRKDPADEYVTRNFSETILHVNRILNPTEYLHLAVTTSQAQQGYTAFQ